MATKSVPEKLTALEDCRAALRQWLRCLERTARLKALAKSRRLKEALAAGGATHPWYAYEEHKQRWIAAHPGARSQEYTAAMGEIAERCGV
jgi:hypothetical protein